MNTMQVSGLRIVEKQDHPIFCYPTLAGKHRSKRKRSRCRVKRFVGWGNVLKDGEVIVNEKEQYAVMNPRTFQQLRLEMAQQEVG